MSRVPLAIFAYRRPSHLRKVLDATLAMKGIEYVKPQIFIDGPKNSEEVDLVNETIEVANQYSYETGGVVTISKTNCGVSKSIIKGITSILRNHNSIIVLEDDLVGAKYFLEFSLDGLHTYEHETQVSGISGYLPDIKSPRGKPFFRRGADCWGWATWADRWRLVEWDAQVLLGELSKRRLKNELDLNGAYCYSCMLKRQAQGLIDSWAIRWHVSMFLQGRLMLYPKQSLIQNIGFDGSGQHSGKNNFYLTSMSNDPIEKINVAPVESKLGRRRLAKHYRHTFRNGKISRLKRFILGD